MQPSRKLCDGGWCRNPAPGFTSGLRGISDLQHVELYEASGKDSNSPDDTHGHEHAEQNVIQHHGHELPLLRSLGEEQERESTREKSSKEEELEIREIF